MKQTLRPYQIEVLKEINARFYKGDREVVIAAAPSSGKTFMITEFIKSNPKNTFLVLTHGTTILKDQWQKEFKLANIKAATTLGISKVTYGLPQGMHRKQLKNHKIDYLVIDEAHEFTFAKNGMVQKVIKNLNPNKIIYLTGTPSKFIKRDYKPIVIPASTLIEQGYVSDLYVGMVSTDAKLLEKDYNNKGDTTNKGDFKLENSVDIDLDNLLLAIHKRLKETNAFKGSPNARKLVNWAPTLGVLNKTMIACNSIKQCEKVKEYFIKHNVEVITSESHSDPESLKVQEFIDNEHIKILVVVNRGILGFNLPELVNVVDLTCSRNIDRIYQLYARVMRKNENYSQKYFFKFSPHNHMVLMKFYMEASLSLLFKEFISKYNGKNLNGFEIPVHVKSRNRKSKSNANGATKKKQHIKPVPIDKLFESQVSAMKLLMDIYNKVGSEYNEYAFTTFGKIKGYLCDGNDSWRHITKESFINFMQENNVKTRSELRFMFSGLYRHILLYNRNWLEYFPNSKPQKYTDEFLMKEALKYKSRQEWSKTSNGQYQVALRNGIIEKCCKHMICSQSAKWTDQELLEEAKKHKTVTDWLKTNGGSYVTALKRGDEFYKIATSHMINGRKLAGRQISKKVLCVELNKVFDSIKQARKEFGDGVSACLRGITKTAGGYHWKYVN